MCLSIMPTSVYFFLFQIKDEMFGALDFLKHVYGVFGFTYNLKLSTRL